MCAVLAGKYPPEEVDEIWLNVLGVDPAEFQAAYDIPNILLRSAAERRDSREQSLSQERSIVVTCRLLCMLMG